MKPTCRCARAADLELVVDDRGKGFERGARERFGLAKVRQRLAWLGGSFVVHTGQGEGTRATARVPLASPRPLESVRSKG